MAATAVSGGGIGPQPGGGGAGSLKKATGLRGFLLKGIWKLEAPITKAAPVILLAI